MDSLITPLISSDKDVYFRCERCDGPVKVSTESQKLLAQDKGIGHKCNGCGDYYIIMSCPKCDETHILNNIKWDQYRNGKEFKCHKCESIFYKTLLVFGLKMSDAILKNTNASSKNFHLETEFITYAKSKLDDDKAEELAQIHGALNVRVNIVRKKLDEINKIGFSGWEAYKTTNNLIPTGKLNPEESAFIISNALTSILDIFSQELALACRLKISSRDSSFNRIISRNLLCDNHQSLHIVLTEFKKTFSYDYICSLRNCLQHRYSIPLRVQSSYKIESPSAIDKSHYPSTHKVILPDNPDKPIKKITFDNSFYLEILFKEIYDDIISLISNSYKELLKQT
ncbi:hypothetical protein [Marinobacterium mangrovicola]|uniref:Uncharacterized protein n=1 Tax=Marinobacterium mangrovicola TaxID=1476959 RepID=A0A4R1GBH2_9GAMM|nr:hypothetical protein [Marinobacterium mangrovicola]TCK03009.1 hypothetical protein CLV83_4064 [Marinobacterium mangrovicola]